MDSAPLPENEIERLQRLTEFNILDTLEEQAYDDLTFLAAQICGTPIALISFIDSYRQWFKSYRGLQVRETPREYAFCAHAILGDDVFVVNDADKDPRFHDNPLVVDDPHVKFYAGAPLILENNIRLGTLCVIDSKARDMSESQQAALAALARQVVSQLALRLKVKEFQQLDRAKNEFISVVSHELRTPLTSIKGALGLLSQPGIVTQIDKVENLFDVANRNTERLLYLVNDMLDIAKMEAGKLELQLEYVDIIMLLNQAIELNRIYVEKCGCELEVTYSLDDKAIYINADEQRLLQVMSNFISNAAKFTNGRDIIQIGCLVDATHVRVNVTDHGEGIPLDKQHRLFQKFSQSHDKGNQKLPGSGLGLVICKHIIELHYGKIGFESIPNKYTKFYFSLPIADIEQPIV